MNKFLLTMVSTLFISAQVAAAQGHVGTFGGLRTTYPRLLAKIQAQGHVGTFAGLRTTYPRLLAKIQAQELATMELDRASAESLRSISIVLDGMAVSPERFGRALPPLMQARVMLHEQEALLEVLRKASRYEISVPLRKIVKLAGNGAIELKHADATEQARLDKANLFAAVYFYIENVRKLVGEEAFVIEGSKDSLFLIRLGRNLEKHGMRTESLLNRVEERKKTGRRDIARALQELSKAGDDPYSTALVRTLAESIGFSVQIEALAKPIVDGGGDMALLGVETKAMIYELAARIAAANADGETLQANLYRILALNNDIDRVTMTVALRGKKVVLNEDNFYQVQQLYMQVFSPSGH